MAAVEEIARQWRIQNMIAWRLAKHQHPFPNTEQDGKIEAMLDIEPKRGSGFRPR